MFSRFGHHSRRFEGKPQFLPLEAAHAVLTAAELTEAFGHAHPVVGGYPEQVAPATLAARVVQTVAG